MELTGNFTTAFAFSGLKNLQLPPSEFGSGLFPLKPRRSDTPRASPARRALRFLLRSTRPRRHRIQRPSALCTPATVLSLAPYPELGRRSLPLHHDSLPLRSLPQRSLRSGQRGGMGCGSSPCRSQSPNTPSFTLSSAFSAFSNPLSV